MATYEEYKERFRVMDDEQLIDAFNREVGNSGWTSSRAAYLAALHDEFHNRNYDCSDIDGDSGTSLKNKIKLIGKKLVIEEKSEAQGRTK
jgi:hypothetical protein